MKAVFSLCFVFLSVVLNGLKAQLPQKGSPAPALHIIKWLKGTPVNKFQQGKVYVVEFGYVACPPCRESIPHLSALSRKYRKDGKAEVISVFTAESDPNNPKDLSYIKRIQNLVNFMGDKMDYSIALDEPRQRTRKDWGEFSGFPIAFIINQEGKIIAVPQRFEGVGYDVDHYRKLYNIFALPTAWLIDTNGILVSANAHGEELDKLLQEYLKIGPV